MKRILTFIIFTVFTCGALEAQTISYGAFYPIANAAHGANFTVANKAYFGARDGAEIVFGNFDSDTPLSRIPVGVVELQNTFTAKTLNIKAQGGVVLNGNINVGDNFTETTNYGKLTALTLRGSPINETFALRAEGPARILRLRLGDGQYSLPSNLPPGSATCGASGNLLGYRAILVWRQLKILRDPSNLATMDYKNYLVCLDSTSDSINSTLNYETEVPENCNGIIMGSSQICCKPGQSITFNGTIEICYQP